MKTVVSVICAAVILAFVMACSKGSSNAPATAAREPAGKAYPTPQAAMEAVSAIAGLADKAKVEEVFGPGATEVLWSGDEDADRSAALRVKAMIAEKLSFDEQSAERVIAAIGKDRWPFPIPLVKTTAGWKFDLEDGKDELLSRRIGRNELRTIRTMYEYVEAQHEYFAKGRDGNPPAYAQRVASTAGKHDGLYWESAEGEEESPLGPFVANAQKDGYDAPDAQPDPFNGYLYKILTKQGGHGKGGGKSFVDAKGLMTNGFAAIAWPATYGNSGVKTFLVSQAGVVFEKDLGKDTGAVASAMTEYDPDQTWQPSVKPVLEDDDDE